MPGRRSHLIERQVFELTADGAKAPLDWERYAARFQNEIIGPAIRECFEDFPLDGQHLLIERLQISLGTFALDRFAKEAPIRLKGLLRERIQTVCRESGAAGGSDDAASGRSPEAPRGAPRTHEGDGSSEPAVLADDARADFLAFRIFLRDGRFPWWYDSPGEMENRFSTKWIATLGNPEAAELRRTLQMREQARIRLAVHFRSEWIGVFLEAVGCSGAEGRRVWEVLSPLAEVAPGIHARLHESFWIAWMEIADIRRGYPDLRRVLVRTAHGDRARLHEMTAGLLEICHVKQADVRLSAAARLILEQFSVEQDYNLEIGVPPKSSESTFPDLASDVMDRSVPSNGSTVGRPGASISERPTLIPAIEKDGLFVQSAGLVLLHPFLPEFFTETGLWDGGAWRTESAKFRAVRLLSMLSSNEFDAPEHRLLMQKVLSGVELETALTAEAPPEPCEIEACEELLQAAIGHWKALRSTSSAGLREAFLQREGKLMSIDNGFQLQVERRAHDVLLSHLPWGYAIIKLPWMNSILHVTWI